MCFFFRENSIFAILTFQTSQNVIFEIVDFFQIHPYWIYIFAGCYFCMWRKIAKINSTRKKNTFTALNIMFFEEE